MSNKNAQALRAARKARIAKRKAEAAKDAPKAVESAYNYNPLYQKPTHLGSDKPRGGYHYYGPNPDAGTSYGLYATASGNGMIAPAGDDAKVHDPASGKPAKLEAKADKDVIATLLAAKPELVTLPPCSECKTVNVTSAAVLAKEVTAFHCTACGEDMTKRINSMKAEMKNKETEAVRYETLSSLDNFGEVTSADVNMTLFDEDTANPYWNIDIQGMPTARVYLSDQPKPEEARAVFVNPQYFDGVSRGIATVGLKDVLAQINARPWANVVNESEKVQELRQSVQAELNADYQNKLNGYKDQLLANVALVCAGMDKNFYRESGNALKESLYASFREVGVSGSTITACIEKAFQTGSTRYFESVLDKAIAYMDLSPDAREQIAAAIGDANTLAPEVPSSEGTDLPSADAGRAGNPVAASTLSRRLADSSVAVSSVSGNSGFSGAHNSLKSSLKLGK